MDVMENKFCPPTETCDVESQADAVGVYDTDRVEGKTDDLLFLLRRRLYTLFFSIVVQIGSTPGYFCGSNYAAMTYIPTDAVQTSENQTVFWE